MPRRTRFVRSQARSRREAIRAEQEAQAHAEAAAELARMLAEEDAVRRYAARQIAQLRVRIGRLHEQVEALV